MILILDNYDSFTYNLVQYVGEYNTNMKVYRNDAITLQNIQEMNPEKIVISPGPGRPEDAGISIDVVMEYGKEIPVLGVCLGHQAVAAAFGGEIIQAPEIIHGKTSQITHNQSTIFHEIPKTFSATRYHSLIVDSATFPSCLKATAKTDNGLIMALEHREYPVFGVQFHPESIATEYGIQIIKNFLSIDVKHYHSEVESPHNQIGKSPQLRDDQLTKVVSNSNSIDIQALRSN